MLLLLGCNGNEVNNVKTELHKCDSNDEGIKGALLASRINSLEELKSMIQIEYFAGSSPSEAGNKNNTMVLLHHCSGGININSILKAGISQTDIIKARDGDLMDRFNLVLNSPYSIAHRSELKNIYRLSRRRHDLYGFGDIAFYDLAKSAERKINSKEIAYKTYRDSSAKGYINSFNHITAQAIITSCFSEKIADFIADLHELYNMPELISGQFTESQLTELDDNPVDNYVDMINNEWGQEIGKKLKIKYSINQKTIWTPTLLANYLNDIQTYYTWAFQISMNPFKKNEEVIIKFCKKMNVLLNPKNHFN